MPQHKPSSAPPQPFQRVLRVAAGLAVTLLVTWSVLPAGPEPEQAVAADTSFVAVADALVKTSSPDKNYGTLPKIQVRAPTADTPEYRSLLQFEVTGIVRRPTTATLRLYVIDPSKIGGHVFAVSNDWTDTTVTWNTQPALGLSLGSIASVTVGTWVEIPLPPAAFPKDGTYSLAMTSSSTNSAMYASRETANPPELALGNGTRLPLRRPIVTPTPEPVQAPTDTPKPDPTSTPTGPAVPATTAIPTPGPTATPTATPTASPTATPTLTPTAKPAATPTATPTPTPTAAPTSIPAPIPPPTRTGSYILIDRARLMSLPTSGTAWSNVVGWAARSATPDLSNQDDPSNTVVLAKALVYARTGDAGRRAEVVTALGRVRGTEAGARALAIGRKLAAYVLAADLIGYRDPSFVSWAASMRAYPTTGGPSNLIDCHEQRPNNWGTHCGASRIAVDLYIGDSVDLARAWAVFRGWVGDRSSYAGFSFGDLSWQPTVGAPVGVNPVGATIAGHNVDGVLPDDQRRGGGFSWPPFCEDYVWEALQGASLQAELLTQGGYPAWTQRSGALRRALTWLYTQANCPAAGDDTWIPWLVNRGTGSSFPVTSSTSVGKNMGFTDWLAGPTDGSALTAASTAIRTSLPLLWGVVIVVLAMMIPRRSTRRRRLRTVHVAAGDGSVSPETTAPRERLGTPGPAVDATPSTWLPMLVEPQVRAAVSPAIRPIAAVPPPRPKPMTKEAAWSEYRRASAAARSQDAREAAVRDWFEALRRIKGSA